MRRKSLLVLAVLICAASMAWAQAWGGKISAVYDPALPHPHVIVTNNYSSPVTGLVIVTADPSPDGRPFTATAMLDTGLNWPHDRPIEPGKSAWLPEAHWVDEDPSVLQPQLVAAVFEDGSSFGDPAWVATIRGRWQAAYDAIGKAETLLRQARAQRLTPDAAVSLLKGSDLGPETPLNLTWAQLDRSLQVEHAVDVVVGRAVVNLQAATVDGVVGDPQRTIPAILTNFNEWRGVLQPLLAAPQPSSP